MALYAADTNQLGFLYESGTYATASGTIQWPGLITNHELTEDEGIQNIRYLGTNDRNINKRVEGPLDMTGTITYFPQDWKMLAFAIGSNVDGGSPDPYTHTISETNLCNGTYATSGADSPFASFTLEDSRGCSSGDYFIRTVNGAIIDTFSISASQGDIVECSVDYVGQVSTFGSVAPKVITEDSLRPFLWSDITLSMPSGTTQAKLKDFEWSVTNNVEGPHYMNGSRTIGTPYPLTRAYSMNVTLDQTSAESKTLYEQYYKGGSVFNTTLLIDASTGSRDMILSMSGCRITEMGIPSPAEGIDEYTMTVEPDTCSIIVNDATELYNAW